MGALRLLASLCFACALVRCGQGQDLGSEGFSPGEADSTVTGTGDASGGTPGVLNGKIIHAYTVSLRRRSDLGYFCAGVLISRHHVLTAAHCLDPSRPGSDNKPLVVVGSGFLSQTEGPGVQVIATKAAFLHPDYLSRRFPDIGIVELNAAANQTPIRLSPRSTPRQGETVEAIGWGRKSSTSGNAEVVQVAAMNVLPNQMCLPRVLIRRYLCMGGRGVGTCEGDNGGPIILPGQSRNEDVLVGIVGDKHSCGSSSKLDRHTNIARYRTWIKSTAGAKALTIPSLGRPSGRAGAAADIGNNVGVLGANGGLFWLMLR